MPRFGIPKFRFTLRTFLIVCLLPVPLWAWIASVKWSAASQRKAIALLNRKGIATKQFAPLPSRISDLMRKHVDQDAFTEVRNVICYSRSSSRQDFELSEADIVAISNLVGVRDLDLIPRSYSGRRSKHSRIENASLNFEPIVNLKTLGSFAVDAPIDERVLLKLADLPELHSLTLPNAQLTDQVLRRLGSSRILSALEFDAALASTQGLAALQDAPVLQTLSVGCIPTDVNALGSLLGCEALTHLTIYKSALRVSDASIISRMPIQTLRLLDCQIERGFFVTLLHSRCLQSGYVRNQAEGGRVILAIRLADLKYCDDHFTQDVPLPVEKHSKVAP